MRKAASHGMPDLGLREWLTVAPLLAAIIAIGVYPMPFLSASRVPVEELIARVAKPKAAVPARPQGAQAPRLPGGTPAEGSR